MKTDLRSIIHGQDSTDPSNTVALETIDGLVVCDVLNQRLQIVQSKYYFGAQTFVDATTASIFAIASLFPLGLSVRCICTGRKPLLNINIEYNFGLFNLTQTIPFNVTVDSTHIFSRLGHPAVNDPSVEKCYTPIYSGSTITFDVCGASADPNPSVNVRAIAYRENFV